MNLTYAHLSDRRLERLANELNLTLDQALGLMCAFWLRSQESLLIDGDVVSVTSHMRVGDGGDTAKATLLTAMVESRYLEELGGGQFRVLDNVQPVRIRNIRRQASVKGVAVQAEQRRAPKSAKAKPKSKPAPRAKKAASKEVVSEDHIANSYTWSAYSTAYEQRYGTTPTRNAKVNKQIEYFVKRVGREEAPRIIAYYVTLNNTLYCKLWHSWDLALKDAETLRSQWKTNSSSSNLETRFRQQQSDYEAEMRNIEAEERLRQQVSSGDHDIYNDAVIP